MPPTKGIRSPDRGAASQVLGREGDGGVRRSSHDSHGDISVVGRGDRQASMRSRNTVDANLPCVGSAAIPHAVASALLSASREHAAEVVSCLLGFGRAEDSSLLFRLRHPVASRATRVEKAPECSLGPERRGAVAAANFANPAVFTPRSRIATVRRTCSRATASCSTRGGRASRWRRPLVELEDLRDLGDRQEVIDDPEAGPGARRSTRLDSGRTERLDRNSCPHRSLGTVAARSGGGAISGLPSARVGPHRNRSGGGQARVTGGERRASLRGLCARSRSSASGRGLL